MKKVLNPVLKYLGILGGSLIYAAAIALFLDPNQLAPGGVSGIAIILNHLTRVPTGTLILIMNVPLLALGLWKLGWKLVASTLAAVVASSLFTDLLAPYGPLTADPLLAASAGGAMLALGIRSGSGDTVIREIARRLTEEGENALREKAERVEPALVLAASVLVGIILLAVMLPLLRVMSALG